MELETSETHLNPQPSQHHRKVELQSQADLTYLQENLAKAARQRLDLHFPPGNVAPATIISLGGSQNVDAESGQERKSNTAEEDEDPLRARVRILVDAFLKQTWRDAQQNISVNGIDASTSPQQTNLPTCTNPDPSTLTSDSDSNVQKEEREGIDFSYAPFDPRLQHKLASLHGELEALTAQVSKLRREAPRTAAERYQATLAQEMETDEQAYRTETASISDQKHKGLDLEEVRDGWNHDVEEVYDIGLRELARLAGVGSTGGDKSDQVTGARSTNNNEARSSLTEVVGRAQRARTVAMEFE